MPVVLNGRAEYSRLFFGRHVTYHSKPNFMCSLPLTKQPVIGDRSVQRAIRWIVRRSLFAIYVLSWGVTAAAAFYGATIIFGFATGYALPPAAIFALLPAAHRISDLEPFLPWLLLGVAAIGAACGWAAAAGILPVADLHAHERRLIRFWSRAGFPVILLTFLFAMSGGGWSGRFVTLDTNYFSIGGLVPHSDAIAYFGGTFDLAFTGRWNRVASTRPLAAAFRDLTVFAGGISYVCTLLVQAILLAGAFVLVLRSVVAWRGIWIATALMALLYGIVRPFLLTTMTEPLGLIWSLISLSFFIETFRQRSAYIAVVAFAALVCGLLTRMGSMFTIPFLMIWIVLSLARGRAPRFRVLAVLTGVLLLILAYNGLLAHTFAAPDSHIGGNFSSIACGLAYGGDWAECLHIFDPEIREGRIADLDQFFLGEAARAFFADPTVAVRYMLQNMWLYADGLLHLLLFQYRSIAHISDKFIYPFCIFLVPGWIYLVKQERGLPILSFGFVLLSSTMLSAALIFGSDGLGLRAMHVTHPFVAMIFATGFAAPLSLHAPDDRPILSWRSGGGAIAALMFVFLLGSPLISHVIRMTTAFDSNIEINHEDLIIVPGGRFMTGFLVLPDTADLPREEPALHASTFARMISIYNIDPEPRLSDLVPQVPFALVYSPVQNRPHTTSNYQTPSTYLTSSTVLTDKSPRRWVLRLGRCSVTSNVLAGLGFCLVEEAKPVEAVIDAR
jgi:hypothetical protein